MIGGKRKREGGREEGIGEERRDEDEGKRDGRKRRIGEERLEEKKRRREGKRRE